MGSDLGASLMLNCSFHFASGERFAIDSGNHSIGCCGRGIGFIGIGGPCAFNGSDPHDSQRGVGGTVAAQLVGTLTRPPQLPHVPIVVFILSLRSQLGCGVFIDGRSDLIKSPRYSGGSESGWGVFISFSLRVWAPVEAHQKIWRARAARSRRRASCS